MNELRKVLWFFWVFGFQFSIFIGLGEAWDSMTAGLVEELLSRGGTEPKPIEHTFYHWTRTYLCN